MFSVECSSGASGGSGRSTMLAGTTRRGEPCQPALSRTGRAMAPRLTDWLISARCWFRASMLTLGMTNAAPRPLVGVEHHLLRLAGMGADKLHAAVAETDVRDLHDRRHAVHHDDLEAPIELVSFARRKRQRHVGVRHLARVLPAPGPGIAANSVIAALISQCPQLLEEPDQSQTFACRIAGVRRKHPVKLSFPTTQLGARLNLPLIRK